MVDMESVCWLLEAKQSVCAILAMAVEPVVSHVHSPRMRRQARPRFASAKESVCQRAVECNVCARRAGWVRAVLSLAQHLFLERFARSVACVCSLKVVTKLNASARMDLSAGPVPRFAPQQTMVAFAAVMGSAEPMATLLCANATRISLEAPAPRDVLKMPLVQSVMVTANVSLRTM